jgi:hypothetical protein
MPMPLTLASGLSIPLLLNRTGSYIGIFNSETTGLTVQDAEGKAISKNFKKQL